MFWFCSTLVELFHMYIEVLGYASPFKTWFEFIIIIALPTDVYQPTMAMDGPA